MFRERGHILRVSALRSDAPAVAALVQIRAAYNNQICFPVSTLDGELGEPIFDLVRASTVYIEKFKGSFGSDPTDHPFDAPLYKVVTNISSPRIKVVDAHALLWASRFSSLANLIRKGERVSGTTKLFFLTFTA